MISKLPVSLAGGVNLWADPTQIRDDQVAYAKNIVPVSPGVYGTRPAMKWARDIFRNVLYYPHRAMFSPVGPNFALTQFNTSQMQLVGVDSDNLSAITLGNAPNPVPTCLVQWDGDSYAFAGLNPGARLAYANNAAGYVLEALDFGTGNADFYPKGAAVIRDRFVYWGFDDGAGGRAVLFADRGEPLTIGDSAVASGRFLPVAAISASGITHCAEINTTASGSPNQSVVAVWTTDQMWMLLGEPGQTGDGNTPEAIIGTLQQNLLPMAAGCVSGATVVQTPYGTIWAGPDDVWFMPFGSLPVRIGTNIRPALLNTPANLKWKWHACYDSNTGQYRLAVFSPDKGPTEYDACDHHWVLDLSRGAPSNADEARWYGPQEYKQSVADATLDGTFAFLTDLGLEGGRNSYAIACFDETLPESVLTGVALVVMDSNDSIDSAAPMLDKIPHADNSEYFVGDEIVPYDEDAGTMRPYVWRVSAVDGLGPNGGGVTGIGAVAQFNDGINTNYTDGGVTWIVKDVSGGPTSSFIPRSFYGEDNCIRPELITKEMLGNPMVDKLIDGAELGFWCDKGGRLAFRFLNDYADNTRCIVAPDDELGVAGFENVGNPNPPTFRGLRRWKTRLLPAADGRRSVAKSIQFRMTQDTVFVVDDTNDEIVIGENAGTAQVVSVTHGEYTYAQLKAAIKTTLENAYIGSGGWFWASDIDTCSLEGLAARESGFTYEIYFQQVGPGASAVAEASLQRCARLFQMLGFDTNAAAAWGTGTGVEYLTITSATPVTVSDYTMARSSVSRYNAFRLQISGIRVRAREFRRSPE